MTDLKTYHPFLLFVCVLCVGCAEERRCSGGIGNVMVIIPGERLGMPVIFGRISDDCFCGCLWLLAMESCYAGSLSFFGAKEDRGSGTDY